MTRRYYFPDLPMFGGTVSLPDDEASHAARVMRVGIGDEITLFDGKGHEAAAKVVSVEKRQVYVSTEPGSLVSREFRRHITVAVALPKGDRTKVLVEKLTELGVHELIPIICARTQGKRKPGEREGQSEKLIRYVVEASKQCERNWLMRIGDPMDFADFVSSRASHLETGESSLDLLAHPGGTSVRIALAASENSPIRILIGPEGGLTEQEVDLAVDNGWKQISLGPRILRVETAAAAIVARVGID